MISQTISFYTILEQPGEGGMGNVHKAQGTKLHPADALRFLQEYVSAYLTATS